MYDNIDNDRDFWADEPTRRLSRPVTRPQARPPARPRTRTHAGSGRSTPVHIDVQPTSVRLRRQIKNDPLMTRLGIIFGVGLLAIPVALTVRSGSEDVVRSAPIAASTPTAGAAAPVVAPLVAAVAQTTPVAVTTTTAAAFDVDALPPATPVSQPEADAAPAKLEVAVTVVGPAPAQLMSAQAPAQATAKAHRTCTTGYTVVAGDYWIGIAKKVGVTTKQLLAANGATTNTALYAKRTICLPAGVNAPATAPNKPAPATTTPKKSAPATTVKQAPVTTVAATIPQRSYSAAEVEAIIREVWPDELEDEALRIARRESNLKPTAKNFCCYGLFQIYYNVHKGWLSTVGVTSANQLLDPRVNANAALTLYNRAGGFGPWS